MKQTDYQGCYVSMKRFHAKLAEYAKRAREGFSIEVHENYLSEQIIGCCIIIHKLLGPGLLESVYEEAPAYELNRKALKCSRQKDISVDYKDLRLKVGFRADIIVEDKVLVELKSVEKILSMHYKQVLTYRNYSARAKVFGRMI